MNQPEISLLGERLVPEPCGALWWPAASTLIVADLHLEKGSSYARAGTLLPPYDTRTTLARLGRAIQRRRPARVVALGDSFHDRDAAARLDPEDAAALARLVAAQEWVWIAGNHDPEPGSALGGLVAEELALHPLFLRHEGELCAAPGEISGHLHPKVAIRVHGRRLSARCFVADASRLLMPAFGCYAGGLWVGDPAIAGLFETGFTAWLLGRERVLTLRSEWLGLGGAQQVEGVAFRRQPLDMDTMPERVE